MKQIKVIFILLLSYFCYVQGMESDYELMDIKEGKILKTQRFLRLKAKRLVSAWTKKYCERKKAELKARMIISGKLCFDEKGSYAYYWFKDKQYKIDLANSLYEFSVEEFDL